MAFIPPDQQPIQRIVGRRKTPPIGEPPTYATQAAMTALAQYRTRAPKGIFIYSSHEEMARDRERWTIAAMVERARGR